MEDKSSDPANRIRNVLNPTRTESRPVAEEESGLPSLREGEYEAHARASNKPNYSIHFVTPRGEVRSFQYVHLDSGSRFAAEQITLVFMGLEPVRVIIDGRNLWRLYDYIHQHRIAWVMVASRDFAKDGQTIVTRVTVQGRDVTLSIAIDAMLEVAKELKKGQGQGLDISTAQRVMRDKAKARGSISSNQVDSVHRSLSSHVA